MSAFPREIVTGRRYLREVESNLPKLARKRALIVWPDSDPGFGDAELRRWQALFPTARTVVLRNAGQFIDEDAPDEIAGAISDWWTSEVSPSEKAPPARAKPTNVKAKASAKASKPRAGKSATQKPARTPRKPSSQT
jgi:hypothetical protein